VRDGVEDRVEGKEDLRGVERLRCGAGGGGMARNADILELEGSDPDTRLFVLRKSSGCMMPLLALSFSCSLAACHSDSEICQFTLILASFLSKSAMSSPDAISE